jgi:hypothetical protein
LKDKAILAGLVAVCVIVPGYLVMFPAAQPTASATVPFAPVKVAMEGSTVLAYELEFTDFDLDQMSLSRVNVYSADNGTLLQAISGNYLTSTFHPRTIPSPTEQELQAGTTKLLHSRLTVFLTVQDASGLTALKHELTFTRYGSTIPVAGPTVTISDRRVPVIGAPLLGDQWGACETSYATSHHIATQIAIGGETRCPQRYAVDFVLFDANGNYFDGNGTNNSDYYCYGKELVASADGIITAVTDGLPDNIPPFITTSITLETATGNMVIIDIGGGNYVQYAHMIPGSIRVAVGDRVTAGQVIGLLGNSGNSFGAHLHFQLGTSATSLLAGEGLPFVIQNFKADGTLITTGMIPYYELLIFTMQLNDPPVEWSNSWYSNQEWIDFGLRTG